MNYFYGEYDKIKKIWLMERTCSSSIWMKAYLVFDNNSCTAGKIYPDGKHITKTLYWHNNEIEKDLRLCQFEKWLSNTEKRSMAFQFQWILLLELDNGRILQYDGINKHPEGFEKLKFILTHFIHTEYLYALECAQRELDISIIDVKKLNIKYKNKNVFSPLTENSLVLNKYVLVSGIDVKIASFEDSIEINKLLK